MDFQVIKDSYYSSLFEKIDQQFPLFRSVFDKKDGVYPFLGELGTFIIENFKQGDIKVRAINFINEAIEQGGSETEEAIVLQLFQKFYENDDLSNQIRKELNLSAKSVFDVYHSEYKKDKL